VFRAIRNVTSNDYNTRKGLTEEKKYYILDKVEEYTERRQENDSTEI
jgi:hypothetical protein